MRRSREPAERTATLRSLSTDSFVAAGDTTGLADDINLTACAVGTVFGGSGIGGDEFYEFSNPDPGTLDVAMTDSGGDDLGVYSLDDSLGGCAGGDAACVAMSDGFFAGGTESFSTPYPGGDVPFYIYVDGYSGEEGPFDLTVTFTGLPENDMCDNAIPIACGDVVSSTNLGSTATGQASCGAADDQASVWYSLDAPGTGTIDFTTCSAGTDYDTELGVYDASGTCGGLACIAGNDDDAGCAFSTLQSLVAGVVVNQGDPLAVMVDGFAGLQGNFDLTVTCNVIAADVDLMLTKVADVTDAAPGDNIIYTLTVENVGAEIATGVVVDDVLPAGLTYVSDDCGAMVMGQNITWDVGTLGVAEMQTCNVTVVVDAGASGDLVNGATASSDQADAVPADNSASATVTVGLGGALGIPTLSNFSLALFVLLLIAGATFHLRRRQV